MQSIREQFEKSFHDLRRYTDDLRLTSYERKEILESMVRMKKAFDDLCLLHESRKRR